MKRYTGPAMLLLTAMIWGAAFVAQSVGMDYVGPFTFNAGRYYLGALVLLPVVLLRDRKGPKSPELSWRNPKLWLGGLLCGVIMFVATSLQQIGLIYTTVGKAGFITALYVVLVPLAGLLLGKKLRPILGLCVALAVVGLYLLCLSGSATFGLGDGLVLCCAVAFTFHILAVDYFSPRVDGVKLSLLQFAFSALFCTGPALLLEENHLSGLVAAWVPLLYTGVCSCGIGYTFQILGQKRTDPTVASILMCMESVFSVIFGWLILRQGLSPRELAGCALMFAAIVLSQLPGKKQDLQTPSKAI